MTSCTCPCSSPSAFSASSASIRSSRVSPIPMRIPLVNGIASSPASRIVSSRRAGSLVRRGPVRAALRAEPLRGRLEHDPHRGRDRPQRLELGARHHAGVEVRQQSGLLEHEPRAALEVLERRLAAERAQLLARDLVAQLRLVAEREERLAAAGRGAGARDREHLLLGHERPLAAPRRPRERAVAADVAAERRQRDEDLRRVRDERAGAQAARLGEQLLERRGEQVGARHSITFASIRRDPQRRIRLRSDRRKESDEVPVPDPRRRGCRGGADAPTSDARSSPSTWRTRRCCASAAPTSSARRSAGRPRSSVPARRRSSPTAPSPRRRRPSAGSTSSTARAATRRSSSPAACRRAPASPSRCSRSPTS